MKNLILLIGVLLSISVQLSAAKNEVGMTVTKTRHPGKNTTAHRTPYLFPLDVYYDDETRQIEVEGDENIEAQVFVCDENGNTLDYSPYINNVLSVPYSYQGVIVIRIENEDWIAIGSIPV